MLVFRGVAHLRIWPLPRPAFVPWPMPWTSARTYAPSVGLYRRHAWNFSKTRIRGWKSTSFWIGDTLPETNMAHGNPPFWWYLSGKMWIFMGYVSFREGTVDGSEIRLTSSVLICSLSRKNPIIYQSETAPFQVVGLGIYSEPINSTFANGWSFSI